MALSCLLCKPSCSSQKTCSAAWLAFLLSKGFGGTCGRDPLAMNASSLAGESLPSGEEPGTWADPSYGGVAPVGAGLSICASSEPVLVCSVCGCRCKEHSCRHGWQGLQTARGSPGMLKEGHCEKGTGRGRDACSLISHLGGTVHRQGGSVAWWSRHPRAVQLQEAALLVQARRETQTAFPALGVIPAQP